MKKFLTVAFVLLVGVALVSCGEKGGMGGQVEGKNMKTEGWIGNDAFQVVATGVSKEGLTNRDMKIGTASEAAQAMAEKRIIEKFVGARLEGAAGAADYASTGVAVAKEFGGQVKGGSIISKTIGACDEGEARCSVEIVYRVEKKNLKKDVQGGATK